MSEGMNIVCYYTQKLKGRKLASKRPERWVAEGEGRLSWTAHWKMRPGQV